jgi:tetratricopeptide (TPR) repeat protein
MSDPRPEEMIYAEKLLDNGKVDEVLEVITNYEKKSSITPTEQLWLFLLRAAVYSVKLEFDEEVTFGDRAYSLTQELGLVPESLIAIYFRGGRVFLGEHEQALDLIAKAEEKLESLPTDTYNLLRIKVLIAARKAYGYFFRGDMNKSLEFAWKGLELAEKLESRVNISYLLFWIGFTYSAMGEPDKGLNYIMKSLNLTEEMGFQVGIASNLYGLASIHYAKGDLLKTLEYCGRSLSIREISNVTKANTLGTMCGIYIEQGELDLAIEREKQLLQLIEKSLPNYYIVKISTLIGMGSIHIKKNEYDQAVDYFNRGLKLLQRMETPWINSHINFYLFLINLERDFSEQTLYYINNLKEFTDMNLGPWPTSYYLLAKAMMLKKKKRSRDRAEAERILNQIVEEDSFVPEFYLISLVTLCDFLLEELYESNDLEIIDELIPLIQRLLKRAENQNSYSYLAEGKLLQAKLALIKMNIEEAKFLLTQAQQIAENHGLILLAQKISGEHDALLDKVDEWDKLKKEDSPMSKRIELASMEGVLNRLQGKAAVKPIELVDEEPILLLIMDDSGETYFNHLFIKNWDYSDLFSSFMSAFNTFSSEIFSKSIDRIRVGDNTILINPVESFLACYVIKGQSYPALQKLTRFTEVIKENEEIWQALNKSVKTSEMLELNNSPVLKTVIDEIF